MIAIGTILDAIVSHAASLGYFERVNAHEPKNAPGLGLTAAVWAQSFGPAVSGSGLASTSVRLEFTLRVYLPMLSEPQDAIDPNVIEAVDALLRAYSGDLTLAGAVRNIDLLGSSGAPMGARAAYTEMGGKLYRIMDITLPVIINDLWDQAV